MAVGNQAYALPQTNGPMPIPQDLYNLPPAQPAPLQDPRVLQGPATQVAPAQPLPTFSQNAVPSPGGMGGMSSPQQQPPTQQSAPVPLPVAWQQYASGLGHPPTRQDYDQFSLDYKTQFVDPSITSIPKIKPQQLKAYQAEYELRARQLGDRLFPGDQADNSHWYSGFGKALGEGAAGEAQKLGGGALAFLGALGNRVVGGDFGDSLMRQGNGDIVHGHNQAGQDREQFLQMMLGHNYNDPQYAVLQNTLGKNFDAANGGASTMAAEGNQDLAQAHQTNRGGALLGQAGVGAIPVAAATLATGGADIPLLAAGGATALANTTGNVADQMNAGQDSDAVLRQGIADSAIGTLLNVVPVHTPGAKLLKRIGQAGAVNVGMATGQQLVDQGLNNSNQFSGEDVLQQGLMGALLGILGGNKEAVNSKNPLKRRSQVGKTPTPEANPTVEGADNSGNPPPPGASPIPEGAEVLGTQVDGSTVVRMPDGHIAMIPAGTAPAAGGESNIAAQYNAAVNTNAHATGMTAEQHANSMKEFNKELNGQGRSRIVQAITKYATTPETAVDGAVQLARQFVPDEEWNAMSAEQRQFAVEEAATYLTKKNPKLDAGAIDQTIQQFNKPAETPAATETPPAAQPTAQPTPAAAGPTGGEQPLPSDISGQQVPGTATQAPTPNATIQSVTAGVLDGTDIPTQAKMLFGVATGDVQNPQLHESPLGKAVMRLVQQGNVSSEADVQKLLTGLATSKTAPGNKVTPKAAEAPTEPTPAAAPPAAANPLKAKTNAEQAQEHDNVASTVTEALAPQISTPSASNKLKARVRKNAEQKYNEQYMQAAMNTGVSGGAGEDAFRSDPHFLAVKTAIQDGRISTPEQLGAFLKNERDIAEQANQQVATPVAKPKGLKKPAAPPPEPEPALAKPAAKPKSLKGGAAKPPKSEAPVANTGAAVTELDQQLRDRFADTLPQHTIDQIHDAVATARMGDSHDLGDLLDGWKRSGDLTNDDVKWLRQQAKEPTMAKATKPLKRTPAALKEDLAEARANESEPNDDYLNDEYHQNNASGESSASLEAQNRLRDERANGQTRAIIRRDGSVEPLSGVDAVDTHARPGEVVVQRGVGKDDWTVLSHGDDLTRDTAAGKLNRVKDELDQVHEGAQSGGHEGDFGPHGEYTLHMDELEQMADERNASSVGTEKEVDKIAPVQTKRRVGEIINRVREGADIHETGAELQKLHDDMEAAKMERALRDMGRKPRRGVEYVRQRLQEMIASHEPGSDHYEAGKFAQWLLDKNPNLANYLAVRIHDLGEKGPGGRFSPSQRLFHINSTDTNPGTAVHEIMHSAEQLMPEDMQNDIRGEYIGRLQNKLKQVIKNGNKDGERYIQLAIENYAHPSLEAEKEMSLLMRTSKKLPYDEFYKYKNPSEYWAVESTDLLNNRWVKNDKADRIKQWLSGFFQHVKSLLGLDSNHKVSRALDAILKSPGEDSNEHMLSSPRGKGEVNDELHDELHGKDEDDNEEAPAQTVHDNSAETRGFSGVVNHIVEQGMNAHVGVEMALQGLRRAGVKITADNNVDYAISRTRGLRSQYNMTDSYDVFKPFHDWVNKNYQRFGNTMKDSLGNINMFFQNTHWLERVRTAWLMQAPMKSAATEVKRAKLLDDVQNLKVDPAVAAKQLETMKSDMKYGWEQWGRNHNVPIDVIQKKLNELKLKHGMDQNSMADLNKIMEGARQRQTQRLQDAGVVSKDDPWVKLYGWKWYVPLKSANKSDTPFWGIAQNGNLSLAKLNSTMAAMKGRSTFSESPVFRLYADTAQAGNAHANATLGDALYNLVSDKKARKALGADIETWEGTPHDGYKNASTGEYTARLKMEPNQALVHDGRTHYVITFPKDSQMARGLWKMNNIAAPDPLGRQVGKVTNAIARIQTTLSPVWQTFTAYARDMTYVPAVLATTRFDNPLEAVPFFARYGVNALKSVAALRQIAPALKSDHMALERMAQADPDSWAAWTLRYMRLGGNNEFVGGFNINDIQDRLGTGGFNNIPRSADGVLDATKLGWNTVLKYTNRYADFVTQIPRVAAFRTLVEQGIDERDAAAEARRVLDYGESGVQGRRINAYKAFFRVAATGVDAMRRSFVKPTGGYDFPKLAKWMGFYSMLGAAGYMTSSMMLGQDEDGKDNIAKMLPETIATRVLFPLGDQVAGWQMGLGLPQIMMAPGALMSAVAAGHVSLEDAADTYAKLVARNSAIETGGSVDHTPLGFLGSLAKGAITPTVVQPLEDIANNVNHWGVPIHGDARKGHFAADSGRKSTPDVFKEQAQWLNSVTNGTVDFYPEDIQYMVRNYGGQWAGTLISQLESQSMTPKTALPIPGLVKDQDFYQQRQLYDTLGQLDNANKRYNAIVDHATAQGMSPEQAKQQADLIVARDPDMQKQRQLYSVLQSAAGQRAQEMKALQANKFISSTGRELQMKQIDSKLRRTLDSVTDKMP